MQTSRRQEGALNVTCGCKGKGARIAPDALFSIAARSADRRRVLQAALCPERILAALDLERRALADVLLEDLAVVPDMLDDAERPVVRQADGLAELALRSEHALDLGVVVLGHLVDVRLGDTELFRVDHGVVGPAHDIAPLVVTMADGGAERLLRDDFRQDDVLLGVRRLEALRIKARGVRREGVAAAGV